MSILNLSADVLPFLQLTADDSFGNVARIQAQAERFFKSYCGRNFEQTAMRDVIRRNEDSSIFLREYPVVSVQKLSVGRRTALKATNSYSATTAQVSVTATAVTLAYNYGAPTALLFSAYATISAMAAAINAAGNGFSATVTAGFEQTLSSELVPQTSLECINNSVAELATPAQSLSGYQLNELTGEVTTDSCDDAENFGVDETNLRTQVRNIRQKTPPKPVVYAYYTAGYAPENMPEDLKLGILALIKSVYDKANEGTLGVTMYRIEGLQKTLKDDVPPETQHVLDLYKRRRM